MTILERFYETLPPELHPDRREVVGPYNVFWEGFVPTYDSSIVVGSYKAWPNGTVKSDDMEYPYLVGIIRGRAWGSYAPGSSWDIRPVDNIPAITKSLFDTKEGLDEIVDAIAKARLKMLAMAKAACSGEKVSVIRSTKLVSIDEATGELINNNGLSIIGSRRTYVQGGLMVHQQVQWVDLKTGLAAGVD